MDRYSLLAIDEDFELVLNWLRALPDDITVSERADRLVYYFRNQAKRPLPAAEDIDQESTPLVIATKPRKVRGTLWTDAEIEFTPRPFKSQFPALYKTSKAFSAWLSNFELVFSQKPYLQSRWDYFLEGGIRNFDAQLYALPKAMAAIKSGQYFVHHRDNPAHLEKVARLLQLRGWDVSDA